MSEKSVPLFYFFKKHNSLTINTNAFQVFHRSDGTPGVYIGDRQNKKFSDDAMLYFKRALNGLISVPVSHPGHTVINSFDNIN
jgi:hypothetical protein